MWDELLDFDKDEDLQRMCSLLSRIPEGLELLRKKFEGKAGWFVCCREICELCKTASEESIIYTKNSETVERSFRGGAGFVASLDKACRKLVNRNAVRGTSSNESAERLARQTGSLLRKNNKMSEEVILRVYLTKWCVLLYTHGNSFS